MNSCQQTLESKLIVYRYSDNYILKPHKWISTTTIKENVSPYNGQINSYILKPGTLVIFTEGLADNNEIIINTDEFFYKFSKITSNEYE